jgi:methylglutaconyl-CoA hydratase
MKEFNTLELEIDSSVATVWLNRPEVHNAFNREMLNELTQCFKFLNKSEEIRVILLRGRGKSFSSGADLKWMFDSENKSYKKNKADSIAMAKCLKSIYSCTKPTIAIVHGAVIGGGIGILCTCDFTIAETNTFFSLSEFRVGLVPSTIMPYLLKKMNQHKLKMLMFSGKKLTSTEAHRIGLIEELYDTNAIEMKLKLFINDILKSSPDAINESKALMNFLYNKSDSEKIMNKTVKSITKMKMSKSSIEGISAYMEKRLPNWTVQIL